MADTTKTLVRMANQIADFFAPYPGEQEVVGVQNHISRFWAPTMRRDLAAHIEKGGAGLKPSVLEAFQRMAQGSNATPKKAAHQPEQGHIASEAG